MKKCIFNYSPVHDTYYLDDYHTDKYYNKFNDITIEQYCQTINRIHNKNYAPLARPKYDVQYINLQ